MKQKNKNSVRAIVLEALPSCRFKLELEDKSTIIGYLSGRMHNNHITILIGDTVEVDNVAPDKSICRIVYRE